MGCDIHIIVERQREDGEWERAWDHHYDKPDAEGTPEIFRNRNYDLFGILADVRNGTGFAGCLTGSGWPSIAPDRGIPSDSTLTKSERNDYFVGDHSFTWVGLTELLAFDWDGIESWSYGVVPASVYELLAETRERPERWSGWISGPDIEVYEPDAYRAAKAAGSLAKEPYVRMGWPETAREGTYDWIGEVGPWLQRLSAGRPLRLVFGFDS